VVGMVGILSMVGNQRMVGNRIVICYQRMVGNLRMVVNQTDSELYCTLMCWEMQGTTGAIQGLHSVFY
jgi:hypothetical protein